MYIINYTKAIQHGDFVQPLELRLYHMVYEKIGNSIQVLSKMFTTRNVKLLDTNQIMQLCV